MVSPLDIYPIERYSINILSNLKIAGVRLSKLAVILVFLIAFVSANFAYGAASAKLERRSVYENETIHLIIETDDQTVSGEIDLIALTQDFTIVGRNTNQKYSIINGVQTFSRQWLIQLEPKAAGAWTIPPLKVGKDTTQALTVEVKPAIESTGSTAGQDVFITTDLQPAQGYVQQQRVLTIKLHLGIPLNRASLSEPEHGDITIVQIGDDQKYNGKIDQRDYYIIERKYALFPQRSGEFQLEPIRFSGTVQAQNNLFGSMLSQGQPIRFRSQPIHFSASAPADEFSGPLWLPGKDITLHDLAPLTPNQISDIKLGQPINRQIQLQAVGLTAEQLPDIRFPESDDYTLYLDPPVLSTQEHNGDIIGIRKQSIAIVPKRSGLIDIAPISVDWWDVVDNEQRRATLPQETYEIIPSQDASNSHANGASKAQPETKPSPSTNADAEITTDINSPTRPQPWYRQALIWQILSALLALGWIITFILFRTRFRPDNTHKSSAKSERKIDQHQTTQEFKSACNRNDAEAARRALMKWAKREATSSLSQVVTLEQFATSTNDEHLIDAIKLLDAAIYASSNDLASIPWRGEQLVRAMEPYFSGKKPQKPSGKMRGKSAVLPELYPD